jgi:TetR/AcrR family transcriptional regulator, transcriptional repressor for nem operon
VILSEGDAATTVDDVCAAAGVTKGSFFHQFKSKEDMTLVAVEHWNSGTGGLFERARFRRHSDPRDRVLGHIDFCKEILHGNARDFTCLLGTLAQQTFETHPRLRDACNDGIALHARNAARDIASVKDLYAPDAPWDPQVPALFTQAPPQAHLSRPRRRAVPPSSPGASMTCDSTSPTCWAPIRARP